MTFSNHEILVFILSSAGGLLVFIGIILKLLAWMVISGVKREFGSVKEEIHNCNEKIQLQIVAHERRIKNTENIADDAHRRLSDHINTSHLAR